MLIVFYFSLNFGLIISEYVGYSPPDPKAAAESYKSLYDDLGGQFGQLGEPTDEYLDKIFVPNLKFNENAASICVVESFLSIRDVENIVKIQPIVNENNRVIRMMLIGCSKPYQKSGYWDCLKAETLCQDDPQIVYSWGPNAPDVPVPPGVGFEIGSKSLLKYLVLEVDYESVESSRDGGYRPSTFTDQSGFALTISRKPMHFKAGSYVFIGTGVSTNQIDVACTFSHENAIFPFGFAMIGDDSIETISAFRVRNEKGVLDWDPIARGNPGWPQVFYPMEHVFKISNGDMLAIRCSRNNYYRQGSGEDDSEESQCSLTFLFFTLVENKNTFLLCTQPGHPSLFSSIPWDFNELVAEKTNILVENSYSKDVLRFEKLIQSQKEELQGVGHLDEDAGLQLESSDSSKSDNKIISNIETPDADVAKDIKKVIFDNHWPANIDGAFNPDDYGEITGIATLRNGSVLFVHRSDRTHTHESFDDYNFYVGKKRSTINEDIIVMLDSSSGKVLNKFGKGLLVLPHGLYVDHEDYVYVTDIAKHQVIKFSLINVRQPMLYLGTSREPGSDSSHFCQPTDVAVSTKKGYIFVADGYCNSRIVKFDRNGKYKEEFKLNDEEHTGINDNVEASSVTVADSLSLVCVASYTHGLVHCFNIDSGESSRVIHSPAVFGSHLTAVTYSEAGSLFYVLAAPSSVNIKTQAFSVDINSEQAMQAFSPGKETGFMSVTYDIVASPENQYIYVCDQSQNKIYKFIQMEKSFLARGVSQGTSSKLVGEGKESSWKSGGKFDESFYSSLAILLLIAIPLTIVVTATIVSRSRAKSHPMADHRKFVSWSSKKGYDKASIHEKRKSKQSGSGGGSGSSNGLVNGVTGMLGGGGKRGFHRLPSVDSDREADRLTDSEAEEFTSQQVM